MCRSRFQIEISISSLVVIFSASVKDARPPPECTCVSRLPVWFGVGWGFSTWFTFYFSPSVQTSCAALCVSDCAQNKTFWTMKLSKEHSTQWIKPLIKSKLCIDGDCEGRWKGTSHPLWIKNIKHANGPWNESTTKAFRLCFVCQSQDYLTILNKIIWIGTKFELALFFIMLHFCHEILLDEGISCFINEIRQKFIIKEETKLQ